MRVFFGLTLSRRVEADVVGVARWPGQVEMCVTLSTLT